MSSDHGLARPDERRHDAVKRGRHVVRTSQGGRRVGHHQTIGRRVAAVAIVLCVTRSANGQTQATPAVGFDEFFRTLYAQAIRDVASNGGPTLTTRNWGGASVLNGLLVAEAVTLPTSSNAGGFAWTYDSTLGTWSR